MEANDKLNRLLEELTPGTKVMTPMELNNIHFSDKRTVITEEVLKRARQLKSSTAK